MSNYVIRDTACLFDPATGQWVGVIDSNGAEHVVVPTGGKVVTARSTSAQGIGFPIGSDILFPAEKEKTPGGVAGVASTYSGAVTLTPRGAGFSGWGGIFVRDPAFCFDTVTIPGLSRNAGLTGTNQWSSIVVEIADASNESSPAALFGSSEIIATGTVAVDPSADILGEMVFSLVDPRGKPIVLGAHNLPARFSVRHRAVNSSGTEAVSGDATAISASEFFMSAVGYSMPSIGTTEQTASAYKAQNGNWGFNGGRIPAFKFSLSSDASPVVVRNVEGKQFLRSWPARLARILDGQAASANLLIFGDSWVQGPFRFAQPIYRMLKGKFGDAGPGFVGLALAYAAGPCAGGADDAVVTAARSGTGWTDDWTTAAKGADYQSCKSATVGDAITVTLSATGFARRAVLHFYRQANGGTVRWKVGAGAWTSISTAGTAGMVCQAIDFGSEITATTVTFEIEVAGADGVILHGVDLRRDIAGVRVHKLGHSGGQASGFAGVAEEITNTELASLWPDAVMFVFTTNEIAQGVDPAVMSANIEIGIRRVRKVNPYADILLVAPFDNNAETTGYDWAAYERALQDLARKHGAAFFPTRAVIGLWGDANRRGMVGDAIPHPTAAGGWLISGSIVRDLLTLGI